MNRYIISSNHLIIKVILSGLLLLGISAVAATGEELTTNLIPESPEWKIYYQKSDALRKLDHDLIAQEIKDLGLAKAQTPTDTKQFGFDEKQQEEWFRSAEGERVMNIILSYQTPSGGWSKHVDMSIKAREKGEGFGLGNTFIPTFDNDATSTQIKMLAQAYSATHKKLYLDAFYRGLHLVLNAQYPNGGWPQNYPVEGGYHDHITYNDNLIKNILMQLHSISKGENEYAFVERKLRKKAKESFTKGLDCVLKTQVVTNGVLTIWGGQHDRITLASAKARNYEMIALATAESAWLVEFLMSLEKPSPEVVASIHSAIHWFESNAMVGKRWVRKTPNVESDPTAPLLWARFYEIGSNKPIYGDRDSSIHYNLNEISEERIKGYAWYNTTANNAIEKYKTWAKKHPLTH